MVQSVVINFSSKVYSKSLLKGSPLLCTSLSKSYLVPEVWRPIFWKAKRIYILFQKYGGRYFEKVLFINLFYFVVSIGIAIYTIVKYVPFIIKTT